MTPTSCYVGTTRNEWWNTVLTFLFFSISSTISYKKKQLLKTKAECTCQCIYCICLSFLMMMILKAIERIRQEMRPAYSQCFYQGLLFALLYRMLLNNGKKCTKTSGCIHFYKLKSKFFIIINFHSLCK